MSLYTFLQVRSVFPIDLCKKKKNNKQETGDYDVQFIMHADINYFFYLLIALSLFNISKNAFLIRLAAGARDHQYLVTAP